MIRSRSLRLAVVLAMLPIVLIGFGPWIAGRLGTERAWEPSFAGPDRLVTNEVAHRAPNDPDSHVSPDWDVTSGSLFARGGAGWTGRPDAASPDASSSDGTGSSVFRMNSRRRDFRDVAVSLEVRNLGLTNAGRHPAQDLDGVHLFLRWQSQYHFYAVSLNRRDDTIVIKKKLPGGPVNGGEYETLGKVAYRVPRDVWQSFEVRIDNAEPDAVVISVAAGVTPVLTVVDNGPHGPVIDVAGAVGLRGDNCEFEFRQFRVQPA
ncbi:MAG TPA: hypothetical protein VFY84_14805 [Jiangellales bacterium]|nr:hypothetical protein [Jiangellales bacterium]